MGRPTYGGCWERLVLGSNISGELCEGGKAAAVGRAFRESGPTRAPHWLEGREELSVLGSKEVCVVRVMLSSLVAWSHTWPVRIEMCSKCKLPSNLEDVV